MICCAECFSDLEIKVSIESLNHKGECPVCGAKNTWIYNSELDRENTDFKELLASVIGIYKPEEKLGDTFPDDAKRSIEEHLQEDWNIFKVAKEGIRKIAEGLIQSSADLDEKLLIQKTGIPDLYDEMYLQRNSIFGKYQWDDFRKYLRNENRFHAKYINLGLLSEVLQDTVSIIPKGASLYRARLAKNEHGYGVGEMGAPPDDLASAGRANSKGVSCLYLANKKETTVKEIRAGAFDYVTIASFQLDKDVKVVDLSSITHNSPFYAETDKIKFLINERHLRNIERDLAKPLSQRDSDLDYLPTQYISDFAKYLGYDGVKYISTFDRNSYNLALFDTKICSCTYRKNYRIDNLDYRLNPV